MPNVPQDLFDGSGNTGEMPFEARMQALIDATQPTYDLEVDTWGASCNWLLGEASRNSLPRSKVKLHISSLKSILSVLHPPDPVNPTVPWIRENIDDLVTRWMNKYHNSGETPKTYKARAIWLLDEYALRCRDPKNYNPTQRFAKYNVGSKPDPAVKNGVKETKKSSAPVPTPEVPVSPMTISARSIQPQDTRLPEVTNEMTFDHLVSHVVAVASRVEFGLKDVKRLLGRLAPQAIDYDLDKALSEQLFQKV